MPAGSGLRILAACAASRGQRRCTGRDLAVRAVSTTERRGRAVYELQPRRELLSSWRRIAAFIRRLEFGYLRRPVERENSLEPYVPVAVFGPRLGRLREGTSLNCEARIAWRTNRHHRAFLVTR